jgi:hypothetical protein
MNTNQWALITIGAALAAVLLSTCEVKAYDKSVCGMAPQAFADMWRQESGEVAFFGYKDKLEGGEIITKYMFVNPETGTWTLTFAGEGNTLCTMRNGYGIKFYQPAPENPA